LKNLKVVTIVGTRPEIIRLSRLVPKLDKYTNHIFVHTGQNEDPQLNEVFFRDLGIRSPDYYLGVDTTSMGSTMGDTVKKCEKVFLDERPDAVMILGDTNSAIAAIVAERIHIPVYHMEAGNRSYDANVPEELNRKMVDHVSSFNLPYNGYSLRNLLDEGIKPRFICITGSPIREIYNHYKDKISESTVVQDLSLEKGNYFLVSVHRQENVDQKERLEEVIRCLTAIREKWGLPVLVSTHPRTRKKLEEYGLDNTEGIIFHAPFGYLDYNQLQLNARCVISDSGTISEESAIIGFSAVSLRDSMERPEAMDVGAIILSGLDVDNLIASVELSLERGVKNPTPEGYGTDNFSDVVLKFLFSTAKKHKSWLGIRAGK
jgi:UDP-N-acetylglucosamine 2-epimerase (non-hydrolysing)